MGSSQPQTKAQKMADISALANVATEDNHVHPADVTYALDRWGKGLVSIAKAYADQEDYVAKAKHFLHGSYAFAYGDVLFKPTLASKVMFRKTFDAALSYMVGGNSDFAEDRGFALNSWVKVEFDIAGIIAGENHALVMGNKILTDKSGQVTLANFTMGFMRDPNGDMKINLHHSSLPFSPTP